MLIAARFWPLTQNDRRRRNHMGRHQHHDRRVDTIESARTFSVSPSQEVLRSGIQQRQHDQPERFTLCGGLRREERISPPAIPPTRSPTSRANASAASADVDDSRRERGAAKESRLGNDAGKGLRLCVGVVRSTASPALPIGSDRPQLVEVGDLQDFAAVRMQSTNHKSPTAALHLLPQSVQHLDVRRSKELHTRHIEQHFRNGGLSCLIHLGGHRGMTSSPRCSNSSPNATMVMSPSRRICGFLIGGMGCTRIEGWLNSHASRVGRGSIVFWFQEADFPSRGDCRENLNPVDFAPDYEELPAGSPAISAGSAIRPGPTAPQLSQPSRGPMVCSPSAWT